jgi:hypothetical protein
MNYRSVFLAIAILIEEKSSTSCFIARHLDENYMIANKELQKFLHFILQINLQKNSLPTWIFT